MIAQHTKQKPVSIDNYPYTTDLGRPSVLTENGLSRWKAIHTWIRTSQVPVAVNKKFFTVDHYLTRNEFYQGQGSAYEFSFATKTDQEQFQAVVNQTLIDYPRRT